MQKALILRVIEPSARVDAGGSCTYQLLIISDLLPSLPFSKCLHKLIHQLDLEILLRFCVHISYLSF